jgi:DNA primase
VNFRALKAAVTMEQVLAHYGLLARFKRGKDSLTGSCPIHRGTNPTQFRVSVSKNCLDSFGDCHRGGNVLDFVAKMENIKPLDAAN